MRNIAAVAGLGLAAISVAALANIGPDRSWLFPSVAPRPADSASAVTVHHLPGSTRSFNGAQLQDMQHAVDWFPASHPAMPGVVAVGRGQANACAFCHLPTGSGRPENSSLAGLPAAYIERQVNAFASGSRRPALPSAMPGRYMAATAKAVAPADVRQAAAYFSKLRFVSHVDVVETSAVAFRPGRFVYLLQAGTAQPIGDRIIEVPSDPARFELRDPHARFTAYVPPGSVAAGRALVASGGPAGQPCTICHGSGLRGGIAPPLAGRSPTMLMRQLAAFQVGARANAEAAPMRTVTAQLSDRQMIALSAYAATLKP